MPQLSQNAQEVLDRIIDAMGEAEVIGAVRDHEDYILLMRSIGDTAWARAENCAAANTPLYASRKGEKVPEAGTALVAAADAANGIVDDLQTGLGGFNSVESIVAMQLVRQAVELRDGLARFQSAFMHDLTMRADVLANARAGS